MVQPSFRIPHQTTGEQLRQKLTVPPGCRVTGEVKHNLTNAVVCRVQGEWNGALEFSYTSGETRVVDVTKLPVTRKNVRPIEKQGPTESRLGWRRGNVSPAPSQISWCSNLSVRCRRLWQHVTESLREKDIEKATEHKRLLEERQRSEERHRAETETPWRTRYFDKEVGRENIFSFRVLEPIPLFI